MSSINFNAQEVEPQSEFTPLPAGEYMTIIVDSELKPTKNGKGSYLQLALQVIDGHYKNRVVFDRLNIQNQNQTAQEIGQRALSALCHAVGVLQVQDSSQLHNIPFIARLSVRQNTEYGDSNEVKAYKSASNSAGNSAINSAINSASNHTASGNSLAGQSSTASTMLPPSKASGNSAKPAWAK